MLYIEVNKIEIIYDRVSYKDKQNIQLINMGKKQQRFSLRLLKPKRMS